jgi:lipid II:glycine glycyltransferase (peptidoglycan interpeptide bridge formation enzyme)
VIDLVVRFAKHLDFRQSEGYAAITQSLNWQVLGEPGSYIYLRKLGPISIAKAQRPTILNFTKLAKLRKQNHIFWTFIEPGLDTKFIGKLPKKPWYVEPYAHSATALVDLKQDKKTIWQSLTTTTRTKIRRAYQDLDVTTITLKNAPSSQINNFLKLSESWSKHKQVMGYNIPYLKQILENFPNTTHFISAFHKEELVSSLLLIQHNKLTTAFCIFTSPLGYHLRAPLLVNWEAISYSYELGAEIFDFFGLYDPRYPKMYRKWQGFSTTKMLFKPTIVSFPRSFLLLGW